MGRLAHHDIAARGRVKVDFFFRRIGAIRFGKKSITQIAVAVAVAATIQAAAAAAAAAAACCRHNHRQRAAHDHDCFVLSFFFFFRSLDNVYISFMFIFVQANKLLKP